METLSYTQILKALGPDAGCIDYVIDHVMNKGMTFTEACDEENLYGDRQDIVEERNRAAAFLISHGWPAVYRN